MKNKIIHVHDIMQTKYSYLLSEPIGKNFDPEFKPELKPKQMLELGVFGGRYIRDCTKEFPKNWFTNAKLHPKGKTGNSPNLNFFKINASQSLSTWRKKEWINPIDPRGWFQWYCRYYLGRRIPEEDKRQIKRWKAINRHIAQIKKNCEPYNLDCRKKQRQAVLHWAYDSRKI